MSVNLSGQVTPLSSDGKNDKDEDLEIADLIDSALISKLDSIASNENLYKKYSEIYSGGVYALKKTNRIRNPDWMSQSANSFREIFYVLKSERAESAKLEQVLKKYLQRALTSEEVKKYQGFLQDLYNLFSDLTHHFSGVSNINEKTYSVSEKFTVRADTLTEDEYLRAVRFYKEYLKMLVVSAMEMHEKIDKCVQGYDKNKELISIFINGSYDSKSYFFSKIDGNWLHWLWTKGFLSAIKKPAENPKQYSYRMPELEYLTNMATKEPSEVTQIIRSVEISEENFNPEVVACFMWIMEALPVEQVRILTAKIRDEMWIPLMKGFRQSGYEFVKIVKKLADSKESNALLELAQAFLKVKTKEEIGDRRGENEPFYVSDLDASGILEALADIDELHTEQALKITTGVLAEIVKLSAPDDSKIFSYEDLYSLDDVDFFTLEIVDRRSYSSREDVKNLAATIKKLVQKTIGKNCGNSDEAKRLFGYIDQIPSCHAIWRLRMFALAQCPKVFKEELKTVFFRLFTVGDNYYAIESGTEYKKALHVAFQYLSDPDQREYIAKVLQYFSEKAKDHADQLWHKRHGWEILSSICETLKKRFPNDYDKCKEYFGSKCDEAYEPVPAVGEIQVGSVVSKSPVKLEDYTVDQIAKNLKDKWSPIKLKEQFKDDDFLSPRGAEGLGDALQGDIKKRPDNYLGLINSFFDRENIHPSYVYFLLRGIEEMLRDKNIFTLDQIGQLFGLFDVIRTDGVREPFKKSDDKSWLADWITVHKEITDILLLVLENKEIKEGIQKKYRPQIKDLITYLFTIKDSPSKEQEKPEYGEPYNVAINSVRGRAYEAFVVFTENDGKTLADDIKELFKKTLTDDSLAVRFVIGRYLATFYFRGVDFITGLLPEIFPKDKPDRKGYLSCHLGGLFIQHALR